MNIFVLDEFPQLAAQYHCDAHVVKMILESAQLLSTAYRFYNPNAAEQICYKSTHINHPCSRWVRESKKNFEWLKKLMLGLEEEWKYRWNHPESKRHGSMWVLDSISSNNFPDKELTPFILAMPECYKNEDPVTAYRNYYKSKDHLLKWKRRGAPFWINENRWG